MSTQYAYMQGERKGPPKNRMISKPLFIGQTPHVTAHYRSLTERFFPPLTPQSEANLLKIEPTPAAGVQQRSPDHNPHSVSFF